MPGICISNVESNLENFQSNNGQQFYEMCCIILERNIWNKFVNRKLLLQEAMLEVDVDDSGTVDFFEFLCVARLISQGKGMYKASALEK